MKPLMIILLLVSFGFLLCIRSPASQKARSDFEKEVGYVEELDGDWTDEAYGGQTLHEHSIVMENSKITLKSSRRDHFIILRIFGQDGPVPFKCVKPLTCPGPIDLQYYLNRRNTTTLANFGRVLNALKGILIEPAPGGANFISRGDALGDGTQDDLVIADDHDVTVTHLFGRLPPGRYDATFTILGRDVPILHNTITWSGNRQLPITIKPGIYELQLKPERARPDNDSAPMSCIILAVKRTDYERVNSLIQQGQSYVATWKDSDPEEAKILLRYLMLSVAVQGAQ
jgi:hypothetical protein